MDERLEMMVEEEEERDWYTGVPLGEFHWLDRTRDEVLLEGQVADEEGDWDRDLAQQAWEDYVEGVDGEDDMGVDDAAGFMKVDGTSAI